MMTTVETTALSRIREALTQATNPIVLWSSGKDSMVVLHLTLRLRTVPVMWWRLAKFPEKQKHGMWVAQQWHLEVHDALPILVEELQHQNWFEVIHGYGPDAQSMIGMTTGILPYEAGKPYLCAVHDLLGRPTVPSQAWPWDVLFQGHREADIPYFGSQQRFTGHLATIGSKRLCNPIYDWSDDQVWGYIKRYKLPIDKVRYFGKNPDVSPDHYRTCFACLDSRTEGQAVWCPKLQESIPSMAKPMQTHRATLQQIQRTVAHVRYTGEPQREVSVHV